MSAHFPVVADDEYGYDPKDVDPWVEKARNQFANPASHVLSASALRMAQFGVVKGGYRIEAVDTALDRLDDAFGDQEQNRLLVRGGHHGARDFAEKLEQVLLARATRGRRKSFDRVQWLRKGYSVGQVDKLMRRVEAHIHGGSVLDVTELRHVVFSPRWAGYAEAQVDAYIDRTVEYLQVSKNVG